MQAIYITGVSAALNGARDDFSIEWELPLAKGWALYHAGRLFHGEPMTWPEGSAGATPRGRWWQRVRQRWGATGGGPLVKL